MSDIGSVMAARNAIIRGNAALRAAVQRSSFDGVREAQFATVSRLPNEASAASCTSSTRGVSENGAFVGCEDIHFTPGAPVNVQASATLYF